MLTEYIVEKAAVAVEYLHEKAALLDPRTLALHLLIDALRLLLDRVDVRRQQPRQPICGALLCAERRPLVQKRIAQQFVPLLVHIFLLFADESPSVYIREARVVFLYLRCL